MDSRPTEPPVAPAARNWTQVLACYREPSHARSIFEIAVTLGPLLGLWVLGWFACYFGLWWFSLILAVPAAGFLVRLFMIQHDCGHGAFFRPRVANDWVGRAIGVLTLTPYDFWRRTHAIHHASSGHLDRRGIGDVETLTVREYLARSFWGRFCYRTYRNPLVMFGLGPTYLFVLQQRLPVGMMRRGWQPWFSTMATNVAIAGIVAALIWCVGIRPFLLVHLPIILLAVSVGVWLFYVQHQFERTFWARDGEWNLHDAALYGSSHYDLPGILRWFTANIGVHHVHHLCSRIPFYRLPQAPPRLSRALWRGPAYISGEFLLRASRALGRGSTPFYFVPRDGSVLRDSSKFCFGRTPISVALSWAIIVDCATC